MAAHPFVKVLVIKEDSVFVRAILVMAMAVAGLLFVVVRFRSFIFFVFIIILIGKGEHVVG